MVMLQLGSTSQCVSVIFAFDIDPAPDASIPLQKAISIARHQRLPDRSKLDRFPKRGWVRDILVGMQLT
jgi:hypothetical protein